MRAGTCILTAAALLIIGCGFSPSCADDGRENDWALWRGPNLNGISDETDWDPASLRKPLKINWKKNVGPGYSNVSISGKYLYTMGYSKKTGENTIYCLDAAKGTEIWRYAYQSSPARALLNMDQLWRYETHKGPKATPVIYGGKVYTLSQNGGFLCNDALTGKLVWQRQVMFDFDAYPPTWMFTSSVHIEGEMAVINAGRAGLALNRNNGALVWKSGKGIGNYSTPAPYTANGKPRLAIFGRENLYGLEAGSGKILWSYPWKTKVNVNAADPVLWKNGIIFIVSLDEMGCALLDVSTDSPVTLWRNMNLLTQYRTPVIIEDYIYGLDQRAGALAKLTCMDIKDGSVRWRKGISIDPGLAAANGHLIVLDEACNLRIVKARPDRYEEISAKKKILGPACISIPVLCRSNLFIRNDKGDIISIDVSKNRSMSLRNYYYLLGQGKTILKSSSYLLYGHLKEILNRITGFFSRKRMHAKLR